MYQGTFVETFITKFGHCVKVNTDKGEWKIFGKGAAPQFAVGTALQFDAVQKGATWSYTGMRVAGAPMPVQPAPAPYTPPVPVAAYAPPVAPYVPPQPTPQGAATHVSADKERDMFVTGVVGRAMGSGQFPATEIKMLLLAADEAWLDLQAKRHGRPMGHAIDHQPPPSQPQGGPPAGDPRFQ